MGMKNSVFDHALISTVSEVSQEATPPNSIEPPKAALQDAAASATQFTQLIQEAVQKRLQSYVDAGEEPTAEVILACHGAGKDIAAAQPLLQRAADRRKEYQTTE